MLSIDARTAEGRYLNEPSHDLTPERIFERNWARPARASTQPDQA